jgi:hypothetical protein
MMDNSMIINDSILSLQIFPQVLPKMQSKLFEECRKPEGHAPLSGTAHTKNVVELLPNDLRGSDLILNEEELKKNVIMTLDPSIHHLFSLEREAKV